MIMNTYELLKSLVGCTITEREDGVIEIAPNIKNDIHAMIKRGDIVYCEDPEILKKWVAIVDSVRDGGVYAEAMYIWNSEKNAIWTERCRLCDATDKTLRYATEEEKQMLLDALYNDRKVWNPDTKQIEEDRTPRVGDQCVFWNEDNTRDLTVGKLHMLLEHGVRYCTENFGAFECCVRFQDFDFETMKPKY